jgi:hypothetical protein
MRILTGQPIRVIGSSPEVVAYAVFGLASLTFPFPYRNRIILAASESDPRILKERFENAAIVGYTTNGKVTADPRFTETITVSRAGGGNPSVLEQELTPRFTRFARLMETILEAQLAHDPYSDYLQLPFADPAVIRQVPEREMRGLISLQQLQKFEATETAKRWRARRRITSHLRNFFLSVDGREVIDTKTPDQLRECEGLVATLLETYALDEHFVAVLKRHRHLIRRRLRASEPRAL